MSCHYTRVLCAQKRRPSSTCRTKPHHKCLEVLADDAMPCACGCSRAEGSSLHPNYAPSSVCCAPACTLTLPFSAIHHQTGIILRMLSIWIFKILYFQTHTLPAPSPVYYSFQPQTSRRTSIATSSRPPFQPSSSSKASLDKVWAEEDTRAGWTLYLVSLHVSSPPVCASLWPQNAGQGQGRRRRFKLLRVGRHLITPWPQVSLQCTCSCHIELSSASFSSLCSPRGPTNWGWGGGVATRECVILYLALLT